MKRLLIVAGVVILSPLLGLPFAALSALIFDHSLAFDVVTGERLKSASTYVTGIAAGWWAFGGKL